MVTLAGKSLRQVRWREGWKSACLRFLTRLCGSYEAMEGGFTTDALIDMTGGIEEAFELNSAATATQEFKEQIKRVLWQAYLRKSMLGCSITVRSVFFLIVKSKGSFFPNSRWTGWSESNRSSTGEWSRQGPCLLDHARRRCHDRRRSGHSDSMSQWVRSPIYLEWWSSYELISLFRSMGKRNGMVCRWWSLWSSIVLFSLPRNGKYSDE